MKIALFHKELVRDRTEIQGHTGGSFFFTRIGSRTYQNSGTYRRVFLFHQNWFATVPKFRDIQEGLSFSPELVRDCTKIQEDTGGSFFFPKIDSRPYQNSVSSVVSFPKCVSFSKYVSKGLFFKRSFFQKV